MRAKINKGYALFYSLIFLLMGLMVPIGFVVDSLEAILVTTNSDTIVARPVDSFDGDETWVAYRYEVSGRTYENTHEISSESLQQCLESDALLIEYSRAFPRFSRLEKPSLFGLLGTLLLNAFLGLFVMALSLSGSLGMYAEGLKAVAEVSRQPSPETDLPSVDDHVDS